MEVCENLSVTFMILLKNTSERNNFAEAIVEALYLDSGNVGTLWEVIAEENFQQTGIVLNYIGKSLYCVCTCNIFKP